MEDRIERLERLIEDLIVVVKSLCDEVKRGNELLNLAIKHHEVKREEFKTYEEGARKLSIIDLRNLSEVELEILEMKMLLMKFLVIFGHFTFLEKAIKVFGYIIISKKKIVRNKKINLKKIIQLGVLELGHFVILRRKVMMLEGARIFGYY